MLAHGVCSKCDVMTNSSDGLADAGWVRGMEDRRGIACLGSGVVTAQVNSYGPGDKDIGLAIRGDIRFLGLRGSSR